MSTTACEDAGPAHVEPQDAGSLKRKRADIDQEQEQELTELERFELEEEGEIVVAVATGMETNEAGAGAGAGGAATATGGQRYFTAQGQTHRDNTPTRPMIDFHNFVKRSLYDKVFRRHGRGATLMEMAGGRGGDLWKIKQQNPSEVVLTDLDAEALQEAERRWEGGKRGARMQLRTVAADMRDAQPPGSFRASGNKPVDVCSCQFSLHYFFETEAAFGNMLATLTDTLAPGGTFMCTLFDGGRVCKLLREAGATARGGDVASAPSTAGGGERVWMHGDGDARKRVLQLKRTWEGDGDLTTLFGNKLVVFLDTIGEHPEYAVDAGLFVKRMEAAHFELVEKTGFGDMYDDWMRSRRRHNVSIPQDMQQFSFLYSAYIFRRHGGSNGGATTGRRRNRSRGSGNGNGNGNHGHGNRRRANSPRAAAGAAGARGLLATPPPVPAQLSCSGGGGGGDGERYQAGGPHRQHGREPRQGRAHAHGPRHGMPPQHQGSHGRLGDRYHDAGWQQRQRQQQQPPPHHGQRWGSQAQGQHGWDRQGDRRGRDRGVQGQGHDRLFGARVRDDRGQGGGGGGWRH